MNREIDITNETKQLYADVCGLIESSRTQVAIFVNSTITALYWRVGKCIRENILHNERAEYGKQTIKTLSQQLTQQFGQGWSEKHLRHCLRFAETFDDPNIVSTLQRQLTWSHIKLLIYIDEEFKI